MTTQDIKLRLGAHMSAAGGVFNAIHIAQKAKCNAVQLFSANQTEGSGLRLAIERSGR